MKLWKKAYFQTIAFSDALYLALPFMHSSWTPDVLRGVGIRISIFCAKSEGLKLDLTTTLTSIFVRPTSRTRGITRNGSEMSLVVRYLKKKEKHLQQSDPYKSIQLKLPHEFKFAVGWNEADGVFRFKFRQFHALMKLAVIDNNRSFASASRFVSGWTFPFGFHDDLVVDSEFAFRHSG